MAGVGIGHWGWRTTWFPLCGGLVLEVAILMVVQGSTLADTLASGESEIYAVPAVEADTYRTAVPPQIKLK